MFIRCFVTNILLGEKYDDKVFNKVYRSLQLVNTEYHFWNLMKIENLGKYGT